MRYALISSSNKVENLAEWDGKTPWPESHRAVLLEEDSTVVVGYRWDGSQFTPPSSPVVDLDSYKQELAEKVDSETEQRIVDGPGFEWPPSSGNFFSLSLNGQVKWLGMKSFADLYDYVNDPPKVRTKDDMAEYTLTSSEEVSQAAVTAMVTIRNQLKASLEAKASILAALSVEDARAAYVFFSTGEPPPFVSSKSPFVVYDVASEGTPLSMDIQQGMIVEATGEEWGDSWKHVTRCTTNASAQVFGIFDSMPEAPFSSWGAFAGVFNVGSAPTSSTLTARFTFDGTTTVSATSTSEVSVGDFIWVDTDFHWFKILEVVDANTLIIDSQGSPIPTSTNTVQRTLVDDPCKAYSSMSRFFKAYVGLMGDGQVWVTTFGGEPYNGDYICSSEVIINGKGGYGQLQSDDILRSSTVAKMTEQVEWSSVTDTFMWNSVIYKKKLVRCTYHCG